MRHRRFSSRDFPFGFRLEPLQARNVGYCNRTPLVSAKCPEDASKLPATGFEDALIWQNAKCGGESARGKIRTLALCPRLPPIMEILPPQKLHRLHRPTQFSGAGYDARVAPTACTCAAGSRVAVGSKNPPMESAYLRSLLHFEFYTLYCSPIRVDSLPGRELTECSTRCAHM